MYVTVRSRGFSGDLPANMPCQETDDCASGLQCCSLGPGLLDLCMTPGDCATTTLKIACEKSGGTWNDSTGGCDYGAAPWVAPEPPPAPVTPPPGPGPSVPPSPGPSPAPAPAPTPEPKPWEDPLILGAGAVVLGVVGLAVMKKKKKKKGKRGGML
jgi:hypothetical protein